MTFEEQCDLAKRLALGDVAPDFVDWDSMSEKEARNIAALAIYEIRCIRWKEWRRVRGPAQRRARSLLRSFLTPAQNRQLMRSRFFLVVGNAGGIYRLVPESGSVARVEKHGSRYYATTRYCLHDPDEEMPPADVTLGQMLLLLCDEPAFIAQANATNHRLLWDKDYLRWLRTVRQERARAKEAA